MSNDFEAINRLIQTGEIAQAITELEQRVAADATCDEAFFLLGKAYNKMGDWRRAIYNYNAAIELNGDSPAVAALNQLQSILDFYNTDLYNP